MIRSVATLATVALCATVALPAAGVVAAEPTPPAEARPAPFSITPTRISVGLLYQGGTIFVHGAIAEGSEVAVRVTGSAEVRQFNRRGRIAGVLWGGIGHVRFRDAPSLYALYTSAPLAALAPPTLRQQLRIGYDAFVPGIVPEGSAAADATAVAELIHLKEKEGLYRVAPRGVEVTAADGRARAFRVAVPIPAAAPTGEIEVAVLELRGGALVRAELAPVHLEHAGIPGWLARLARERGPSFGLLSVFVLLLTGLAVDLLRGAAGALLERAAGRAPPGRTGPVEDGKASGT